MLLSKFKMGHSNGSGSFHPSESTSCSRRHWQKVEERGKKREEGERESVGGAINLSPSFTILQWIAAVAADKNWAFFFFLSFFSGDYLQSGARVEVRSQQSRGREDTAREGEKRRRMETGEGGGGRGEEGKQGKREDEVQIRGQWKMERWKGWWRGDMRETMKVRRQVLMTAGDSRGTWKREIKPLRGSRGHPTNHYFHCWGSCQLFSQ